MYEKHMKNTLAMQVACNEHDIIRFLLRHNIPFTAATHYGHHVYIYKKDSPYMITVPVYASKILMYEDFDELEREFKKARIKHVGPKAEKIYVNEYLKGWFDSQDIE